MEEIAAKKIIGMPVYSIHEGESMGVVRNIIIDPENKCAMALAIDRRGWYRDTRIVPFSRVRNIGNDAVTVEERSNAERMVNLPQMVRYLRQPVQLVGSRVMTDRGDTLGRLEEYYLERQTGAISRIDITGGSKGNLLAGHASCSGDFLITIGGVATVLAAAAAEHLTSIDTQLKQNALLAREKAKEAWNNTVSSSKKFSHNLGESFNKAREDSAERAAEKAADREQAEKTEQADHAAPNAKPPKVGGNGRRPILPQARAPFFGSRQSPEPVAAEKAEEKAEAADLDNASGTKASEGSEQPAAAEIDSAPLDPPPAETLIDEHPPTGQEPTDNPPSR